MKDLDIAKKTTLQHISSIAEKFGLKATDSEMYGKYQAKLPLYAGLVLSRFFNKLEN